MSNERAPERIYLQDWADPITWCVDRIDADLSDDELDTEYVRLDLYAALEQERDDHIQLKEDWIKRCSNLTDERDRLRAVLEGIGQYKYPNPSYMARAALEGGEDG